jgi:hypothetical protein
MGGGQSGGERGYGMGGGQSGGERGYGMGGGQYGGERGYGMGGGERGYGMGGGQYGGERGQWGGGQGTTGGQYGMSGGQYGGQWGNQSGQSGQGLFGTIGEGINRLFGKGPKGYSRSDERIKEDVCDRLMMMSDVDSSDVEVAVVSGEVTLTGNVPDRNTKYRIEHLADQIGGVKDINNQLRVKRMDQQRGGMERGEEGSSTVGSDQPDRKRSRS